MGECDYKCPVGHIEDPSNPHLCLECGENCPKSIKIELNFSFSKFFNN